MHHDVNMCHCLRCSSPIPSRLARLPDGVGCFARFLADEYGRWNAETANIESPTSSQRDLFGSSTSSEHPMDDDSQLTMTLSQHVVDDPEEDDATAVHTQQQAVPVENTDSD